MAIFGNDNGDLLRQINNQLGQMLADLAAVKQQVTDQQHTIDMIRQDTAAAITTGLAEIRSVAREALARTNDAVAGSSANIGSIGNELVAIRGAINSLDTQLRTQAVPPPTADADAPPEPDPTTEPAGHHENIADTRPEPAPAGRHENNPPAETTEQQPDSPEPDPDILRAAAGIAHATVQAHRDTWAFLIQTAGNEQHFHIPGKVEDDDGFVSARFSGPSLVAAITSLARVVGDTGNPVTKAIAAHIQAKITAAVRDVMTNPHSGSGADPIRIAIDDRAKSDSGPGTDEAGDDGDGGGDGQPAAAV